MLLSSQPFVSVIALGDIAMTRCLKRVSSTQWMFSNSNQYMIASGTLVNGLSILGFLAKRNQVALA